MRQNKEIDQLILLVPDNPSTRWQIPFSSTSTITHAPLPSPKMISTRTSFTLKTPATIRCAHILGSWDLYSRQLPLMKVKEDKEASTWNNTFEFQITILQPGKRYWYYVCKCKCTVRRLSAHIIIVHTQWIPSLLRFYKCRDDRAYNLPNSKHPRRSIRWIHIQVIDPRKPKGYAERATTWTVPNRGASTSIFQIEQNQFHSIQRNQRWGRGSDLSGWRSSA